MPLWPNKTSDKLESPGPPGTRDRKKGEGREGLELNPLTGRQEDPQIKAGGWTESSEGAWSRKL